MSVFSTFEGGRGKERRGRGREGGGWEGGRERGIVFRREMERVCLCVSEGLSG